METTKDKTTGKQKTVSIKRTFNLPIDTVWKAWSQEESFKKWWGPKNYTCPSCTIDFKVGGKCLASMKGEDGKEIWSTGTYQEIVKNKKIVVTDHFSDSKGNIIPPPAEMGGEWGDELLIMLDLEEDGDKTNFLLKHKGLPEKMYDECIKSWNESLDKLENNLKG